MYKEYKIGVFGLGGVGKSSIVIQFVQNIFIEEYDPTLDEDFRKQCDIDGELCMLTILDSYSFDNEFTALRDQYIRNSEGYMIVYSIASRFTFEECEAVYEQFLRVRDVSSVPVVVCGNKSDLEAERQVTTQEGRQFATSKGADFFETSAKLRINIEESFFECVRLTESSRLPKFQNIIHMVVQDFSPFSNFGNRDDSVSLTHSKNDSSMLMRSFADVSKKSAPLLVANCLPSCVVTCRSASRSDLFPHTTTGTEETSLTRRNCSYTASHSSNVNLDAMEYTIMYPSEFLMY
eukprot:TRINITY_DN26975_c0_g1_i1.p1 TRINITY_DN26975_c0_g1~~TRINITY_DN26975_c0_g1_i1.p1  ORF type:complete len:292 (+),score=35.79 TRINITY_DN26975_c0_g1_i1:15-890(+)